MLHHRHQNSLRGFTLVELLVVIGIIAILVAVSFPALNSALSHARTAKCSANLRNISAAMISFASDNNGSFPISGTTIPWGSTDPNGSPPAGSGQYGWCQQVGSYLGVNSDPTTGTGATVFQCPDWALVPTNKYYSYYSGTHASYSANGNKFAAVVLSAIHNPSLYILAGDISFPGTFQTNDCDKDNYGQDPSFGSTSSSTTTYLSSPIHGGTTNIAFADGHVENVRTFNPLNMTTVYPGPGANYFYLY